MKTIEDRLADIADALGRVERKVEAVGDEVGVIRECLPRQRVRIPDSVRATHVAIARRFFQGNCPCCHEQPVIVNGKVVGEFDHATDTGKGTAEHTWLVCQGCNRRMRDAREPADRAAFDCYQRHLAGAVQLPLRPLAKAPSDHPRLATGTKGRK